MGEPTKSNYIRPEDKKRWGFGGDAKEIKVATEKADDAESVETKRKPSKSSTGNGSGETK